MPLPPGDSRNPGLLGYYGGMSTTLEALKQKLHSEDLGDRLRALTESRSLIIAERFELVSMAVQDRNARVRYDATSQMSVLGKHDLAKAAEILRDRLLNDPEMDVKAAAADSIGALQLTDALDTLTHAYNSFNDWILQLSVVAALGELGDRRGFEFLANALNHPNELIKIAAVGALGELGDPRAVELVLPLVDNADWQIRHRVAQALGQFDNKEACQALQKLSQDEMEQVAETAKFLLLGKENQL